MNTSSLQFEPAYHPTNLVPISCFVGFCLIFNPILFVAIENSRVLERSPFFISLLFGCLLGQFIVLSVICGLGGRYWINGFMLANAIAAIALWLIVVFNIRPTAYQAEIATFWCVPAALLTACLPQLAMRLIRRWRITDSTRSSPPTRIEDYLIMMAALGSCIALCRASYLMVAPVRLTPGFSSDIGVFWFYVGIVGFIINLFCLPAIAIAFQPVDFSVRLVLTAVYSLFVWILVIVFFYIRTGGGGRMSFEIFYLLATTAMACLVANLGLSCLRLSGFFLRSRRDEKFEVRHANPEKFDRQTPTGSPDAASGVATASLVKPAERVIDPFSDEVESEALSRPSRTTELDQSQLLARWLTFVLISLALTANLCAFIF